jgi:hypothetical protein
MVAAVAAAVQQSSRCSARSSSCACDTVMRLAGATDITQHPTAAAVRTGLSLCVVAAVSNSDTVVCFVSLPGMKKCTISAASLAHVFAEHKKGSVRNV